MKQLLNKYNIKPSKKFGQNFLIDESILEKIIVAADISPNDIVLEIGPGLGILTFELAKRAKRVIAVEKDKKLAGILSHELKIKNIKNAKIINNDILKIQISDLKIRNYKLVANLPYYIASPVIRMFLENPPVGRKPEAMILMVQKEVAQRICAKPPQMSILGIAVQFYGQPEIIDYTEKKSFYPQPKVDSAIIKIIPKEIPKIDTEKFFALIKMGFAHKRKILISNLSLKIKIPKPEFQNLFTEAGADTKTRAENLSVSDWLKLYAVLKNYF